MNDLKFYNFLKFQRIPLTRIKLRVARILYSMLHPVLRKDVFLIRRRGISFCVDLSEGIDLSLFLFGNFQNYITRNRALNIPEDAVIFDIGANIGSMALRFAQRVPRGHVFAFEPTTYAFEKLMRNVALNPDLARRITPLQLFVSDSTRRDHDISAYASWKVDGSAAPKHPVHGGILKAAESTPAISLDDFSYEHAVDRVNLIKIDTDGHEFKVLAGARRIIEKHLPFLIFEIGHYVLDEQKVTFAQYFEYLSAFGYKLINAKNGKTVALDNFKKQIPWQSTTDLIGMPPVGDSHASKLQ